MKLGIYAICKNEIDHIEKWLECVKEADEVVIVDTGSTDGTWEIIQKSGVKCEQKIFEPFRFDVARNYALSLVSEDCDICIPLDPDMSISKGYCNKLKNAWEDGLGLLYVPMYDVRTNVSGIRAIHKRKDCEWVYPTYEQIRYSGREKTCTDVIIYHDYYEGRPTHYMAVRLAKLGVEENPFDPYCIAMYERAVRDYGKFSE